MKKHFVKLCLVAASLGLSDQLFAQGSNPLIGKWRWDALDCKKPDFIFEENRVIQSTDADGEPMTLDFNDVKYSVSKAQVTVDFGKPHGLGKAPDISKLTFKMADKNHAIMVRKIKGMNDLYRCP